LRGRIQENTMKPRPGRLARLARCGAIIRNRWPDILAVIATVAACALLSKWLDIPIAW
jgi:hypothetical protein